MASNSPESKPPAPALDGLRAMLARLRVAQELTSDEPREEGEMVSSPDDEAEADTSGPGADVPQTPGSQALDRLATRAADSAANLTAEVSLESAAGLPEPAVVNYADLAPTAEAQVEAEPLEPAEDKPLKPAPPPALCPVCNSPRVPDLSYCADCGLVFSADMTPVGSPTEPASGVRLMDRYELGELISQRGDVCRYRGLDHGAGTPAPVPVIVVRGPAPASAVPVGALEKTPDQPGTGDGPDEILPSFDFATLPTVPRFDRPTEVPVEAAPWPTIAWERELLDKARYPALPQVVGDFVADGFEYLVEEVPAGRLLWDAWDDPESSADQRFGWLKQIAEALHQLHQAGAMLEGLRPDIVVVTRAGQAMLTDLSDLLPLPLPADAPTRGSLYSAPELILAPDKADARADLYSFGAMLYALHVGRELTETAFERPGVPKPFIPYFPDVHPLFGRLISKTFWHDIDVRFPTEEASKEDPTGFTELIRTLEVCRRTLGNARLDIAAWTTTGIIRTGNEDAFALMHAIESRQDDLGEHALVLLADGMGGYEAGEVAAGMAIQAMRKFLLRHPLFSALAGDGPPPLGGFNLEGCKEALVAALKEANREVFAAARAGGGRRGMGCTAEAVYVDGEHVVVGHVGDSRTYQLREGRLVQITRDQTLVGRLLELGQLTPEEAEAHPRRSELQQAIGGRADVDPESYHGRLKPGDWVMVCSDGLTNHVKPDELQEMLQSEATSAEMAARRLVNFANLRGATDNATVVVIRAT